MAGTAHPTRRPGSFENQLRKQTNSRLFQEASNKKFEEKAKLTKQLQDARNKVDTTKASKIVAEKNLAEQRTYLKYLEDQSILPGSPGGTSLTTEELQDITNQKAIIAETRTQVQTLTTMFTEATNKVKAITKELTPGPSASTKEKVNNAKANSSSSGTRKNTGSPSGANPPNINPFVYYTYNVPMIKNAYLNPFGVQGASAKGTIDNPGNYLDAKNAWANTLGAKGTIQMSRQYAYNNPATQTNNTVYDNSLYGFKFLYNPKEVSMAWGTSTEVNWDYVSLGLDKASAVALGILKSTITFSLLLNRMGDMSFIDESGLSTENVDSSKVYPTVVGTDDMKTIYKRGTMYDLEYLFKTVMGLNANYESTLNGRTADRGWLNAAPVELHLGDGMRYLVRISTLDVNHMIFNERMVPILSTVNITCHRFYDGTDASLDNSKSTSGGK